MSKDEQQKRGGFVPIGDLAIDLPGVRCQPAAIAAARRDTSRSSTR